MPLLVSSLKSLHTLMCFHENVCSGTLLNWWQHEGLEGLEVYMSNILTLYQDRTEPQNMRVRVIVAVRSDLHETLLYSPIITLHDYRTTWLLIACGL